MPQSIDDADVVEDGAAPYDEPNHALSYYDAEEFEEPFYSLLVALGQETISAVDYEVCAACDAAFLAALIASFVEAPDDATAAGTAQPQPQRFEAFLEACRQHLLVGDEAAPRSTIVGAMAPCGGIDVDGCDCDDERGAIDDADVASQDQQFWTCTRCKFEWNPWDMEACRTCAASCYCEETPLVGGDVLRADTDAATGTVDMSFPSMHALQTALGGADLLRVFEVLKSNGCSGGARTMTAARSKKRRYAIVHFPLGALLLYDSMPAYPYVNAGCTGPGGAPRLVTHDASMLYRVERMDVVARSVHADSDYTQGQQRGAVRANASSQPVLRLYFFRASHPMDLLFDGHETRERFMELLMLLRQPGTPVLWCPSLCRQYYDTTILRLRDAEGSTHRLATPSSSSTRSQSFAASRSPYEVVRVFATCMTLDGEGELPMAQLEPLFRIRPVTSADGSDVDDDEARLPPPPDADADNAHVVCVAIQRLSAANMKQLSVVRKAIPQQILDILGNRGYYLMLNSADNMNAFAGLDGVQGDPVASRTVVLLFARKTVMHKISTLACWSEAIAAPPASTPLTSSSDVVTAVTVSFRFLESPMVVAALDTGLSEPDDVDTAVKHAAMQAALGCGGGHSDTSLGGVLSRSDYAVLMGHWGYSTSFVKGTLTDELAPEIEATHILSEFEQGLPSDDRRAAVSFGVPGHTRIAWRCLHRRLRRVVATASQFNPPGVDGCVSTASASLRLYALRCYAHALLPIGSLPTASLFLSNVVVRSDVLQGSISKPLQSKLSLRMHSPCFGSGVSYAQPLRPLHAGQWQTPECFSGIPLVGAAFEWARAHAIVLDVLQADDGSSGSVGRGATAANLLGTAVVPLRDVLQESMRDSSPRASECDTALYRGTSRIGTVHLAVAWGNGRM